MADALLTERVGPGVSSWVAQIVVLLMFAHILTLQDGAGALLTERVGLLRGEADQKVVLCLMFRDVPLKMGYSLRGFHTVYISLPLQLLYEDTQLLMIRHLIHHDVVECVFHRCTHNLAGDSGLLSRKVSRSTFAT